MCSPGLGALTVGLVAGAIQAGTSAYAARQDAKAQAKALDYNRAVAEANAKMADEYAANIQKQGEWEKRQLALEMLQKQGQAKTQYAAAGVALGSGTPADYMADIADAYDLDSRQLDYDIRSRAYQAKVQGVNYRNQAGLYATQKSSLSSVLAGQYVGAIGGGLSTGLSTGFAAYGAFSSWGGAASNAASGGAMNGVKGGFELNNGAGVPGGPGAVLYQ